MYDLLIYDPEFESDFTHDGYETYEEAEKARDMLLGQDYFGIGMLLDESDTTIDYVG